MRVNLVNNIVNNSCKPSFKHTAVPYPEFETINKGLNVKSTNKLVNIFTNLFRPEVTKESKEIKSQIDKMYNNELNKSNNNKVKGSVISVVA